MKRIEAILLPLDGSPEAAKAAGCALWIAHQLGATLHLLHVRPATARPFSAADAPGRLGVPQAQAEHVVVHEATGDAAAAVLEAISAHRIDLVVMSARGESAPFTGLRTHRLGSTARSIIERSPVPAVLVPARYRESLPWTSMLVASSGEAAADRALENAVRVAAALRLEVTAVHCLDSAAGAVATPLASYADAPHHEFAHRLEQMMKRGLARCSADEAGHVCGLQVRCGEPASELLEHVAQNHSSVIALGWHGRLDAGRAPVLKQLLEQAECALLVVREAEGPRARLKVEPEFGEAG